MIDASVTMAWFFADKVTSFTEGLLDALGIQALWAPGLRVPKCTHVLQNGFERYNQVVRREYDGVPGFRYGKARVQVLQSLLDRPRLYHGEGAVALLDSQARINLAAALSRLAQ
ncbi:MAG: hypothetical protein H0U56_10055 [Methylibium sp.]|nr:hypothetical protein [Methylibium sp.]